MNSSAFQGPPDPNLIPAPPSAESLELAHGFARATISLLAVSSVLFGARIWSRTVPVIRLGWDDYLIAVGYVRNNISQTLPWSMLTIKSQIMILVDSILLLLTVPFVFNRDPSTFTLADVETSYRYAVLSEPVWSWSMAAVKLSVAALLLRLEQAPLRRRFIWFLVAVQIVLCIYNTFSQLLQCIPLSGAWDLHGASGAKCWSQSALRASSIITSSFNIVTDVVFALLPITFLRGVQRPLRERVVIAILMGLGLFAGAASSMKAVAASQIGQTGDSTAEGIRIGRWSIIEEQVGFIAACIPCLRSPFQRILRRFGLISTQNTSRATEGYPATYGKGTNTATKTKGSHIRMNSGLRSGAMRLKSLKSQDAQSEENILPNGEEARKNEIWRTTELRFEEASSAGNSRESRIADGQRRGSIRAWADGGRHSMSGDEQWGEEKLRKDDVV
jgi:hypothetical protein